MFDLQFMALQQKATAKHYSKNFLTCPSVCNATASVKVILYYSIATGALRLSCYFVWKTSLHTQIRIAAKQLVIRPHSVKSLRTAKPFFECLLSTCSCSFAAEAVHMKEDLHI